MKQYNYLILLIMLVFTLITSGCSKEEVTVHEIKVYSMTDKGRSLHGEVVRSDNAELVDAFYRAIQDQKKADPKADAILEGRFYIVEIYKGEVLEKERYEMWVDKERISLQYGKNNTKKYVLINNESEDVIRQFIENMRD